MPPEDEAPALAQPRAIAYEPPAILWEEPFEPVALALSCNHQEINPGCSPGPYGT